MCVILTVVVRCQQPCSKFDGSWVRYRFPTPLFQVFSQFLQITWIWHSKRPWSMPRTDTIWHISFFKLTVARLLVNSTNIIFWPIQIKILRYKYKRNTHSVCGRTRVSARVRVCVCDCVCVCMRTPACAKRNNKRCPVLFTCSACFTVFRKNESSRTQSLNSTQTSYRLKL